MNEGDNFRMIISVPEFGDNPARSNRIIPTELVTHQVTEQVRKLLLIVADMEMSAREAMETLGLKHRPTFLYDYLQPSLEQELVEMTQPDAPKSPTQKYRLTNKGRAWLKENPS